VSKCVFWTQLTRFAVSFANLIPGSKSSLISCGETLSLGKNCLYLQLFWMAFLLVSFMRCCINPILSYRPLLVLCCVCHRSGSQWQQTALTRHLWYPSYSRWTWCGKCSWKSFLRGCVVRVVLWYTRERYNGLKRM